MRAEHLFAGLLLSGEPVRGDPAQATMLVSHIKRCHHTAEVMGEKTQNIVAQHGQGQLPEHCFGQLRLAGAQPGLLLQALGRALLGLQAAGVARRQRQQVAPAQKGQQCTEQDDKDQIDRNRHHGEGADFFAAGLTQLLFHANERVELLADFVGDTLAATAADRLAIVRYLTTQTNHLAGKGIPVLLQCLYPVQPVHLLRVVLHQLLQVLERRQHLRLGHLVGVKKAFVTGDQKTAHAGFHVNGQFDCFVGVVDHPISVLQPLDGRQQIADHRHEHHSAEQADPQRQANVTAQQLAKALLIYRGWLNHLKRSEQVDQTKECGGLFE
ncbi:hypothetical protein D3C77_387910 [compost metagenome]